VGGSTFLFTVNLCVYVFQNIYFASVSSDVFKFFNKGLFEIAAEMQRYHARREVQFPKYSWS